MRVLLDGNELPSDVTASVTTGMNPWVNLRGNLASAKLLSAYADGTERTLEVYDPQDAASIEAVGPARGGFPDGSFYS